MGITSKGSQSLPLGFSLKRLNMEDSFPWNPNICGYMGTCVCVYVCVHANFFSNTFGAEKISVPNFNLSTSESSVSVHGKFRI